MAKDIVAVALRGTKNHGQVWVSGAGHGHMGQRWQEGHGEYYAAEQSHRACEGQDVCLYKAGTMASM